MKIIYNGNNLDFQLGSESSLGEIMDNLSIFLAEQNQVLKSWTVDGQHSSRELNHLKLDTIGTLEITSIPAIEEEYQNLQLTADFFVLLRHAILEGNIPVLEELSQEYNSLYQALDSVVGLSFHKGFYYFTQKIDQCCENFRHQKNPEIFAPLPDLIQTFLLEMDSIARGLGEPELFWSQMKELRGTIALRLMEVSVQLSTNKDKAALDTVLILINNLESTAYFLEMCRRFRLDFFQTVSGSVEILTAMNPFMKDITDAMERKDYILVGDLLEYEIAPLLERLP